MDAEWMDDAEPRVLNEAIGFLKNHIEIKRKFNK
jgi:hypothetical protein